MKDMITIAFIIKNHLITYLILVLLYLFENPMKEQHF